MPYKLSRLKKIYLLLLITTIFTVSLYATKTVFSFVTGKNDNEEEYIIIEKGAVGDEGPIDVNETMDYPFEIHNGRDLKYYIDTLDQIAAPEEDKKNFLGDNAAKLLHLV